MRDADARTGFLNEALNLLRVNAAALRIDVRAVRLVVRDRHFRAKLAQNAWGRLIGGAVRHIDSDPHFLKRHTARKARFGKFDITAKSIIDTRRRSYFSGGRPD